MLGASGCRWVLTEVKEGEGTGGPTDCGGAGCAETIPVFDERRGLFSGQVNIIRRGCLQDTAPFLRPPEGQSPQGPVWRLLLCDCKVIQGLAEASLGGH